MLVGSVVIAFITMKYWRLFYVNGHSKREVVVWLSFCTNDSTGPKGKKKNFNSLDS